MPSFNNRFRPMLESLEARDVPAAGFGNLPQSVLGLVGGIVQGQSSQMQVNYNALFNDASRILASQQVNVQNGVADVTQAAKTVLESDILSGIPRSLGSFPLIGEVTRESVTLNRLTLDKNGNFNGQMTVVFKYQMLGKPQYASVQADIVNNQLKLSSDNALVRQFGKLEQRGQEWQPKVAQALAHARTILMPVYFSTTGNSTGIR
jgi:hypothetical protein